MRLLMGWAAVTRQGERYHKEITVSNASTPVIHQSTVTSGSQSKQVKTYTPASTTSYTYDADGNLTCDGRWYYYWNAENQLSAMSPTQAALNAGQEGVSYNFTYDHLGRRSSKVISRWADWDDPVLGGRLDERGYPSQEVLYQYDGWNLLREDKIDYSSILSTWTEEDYGALSNEDWWTDFLWSNFYYGYFGTGVYLWGHDLSGLNQREFSPASQPSQGAGGVGGLLACNLYSAAYDGNGNVIGWLDGQGQIVGKQEYDPFGQRIIQEGSVNLPVGFSSKYRDEETGLSYYGYRYYDPVNGRWISRDPIEEKGGNNSYEFIENRVINNIDVLGCIPPFYNYVRSGRPSLSNAEVEFGYRTLSYATVSPCAGGLARVVWNLTDKGYMTGFWGVSEADWNHEAAHCAGYEKYWNSILTKYEGIYFNRCMCQKAADCYSAISPTLGLLVYTLGSIESEKLHRDGGYRNGFYIAPYSVAQWNLPSGINKKSPKQQLEQLESNLKSIEYELEKDISNCQSMEIK